MNIIQNAAVSLATSGKNDLQVVDLRVQGLVTAYQHIRKAQEEVGGECVLRVKVASGGAKQFTIELGPDEESYTPDIEGVIFYSHECNARFDASTKGVPPLCSSPDGKVGFDAETGDELDCDGCHHNRYGSGVKDGKKARGKSCKNMRRVYILVDGCHIPLLLTLPPTSLRAYQQYRLQTLAFRGLDPERVVTRLTLAPAKSADGDPYSVVNFKLVGTVTEDVKAVVDVFAEAFRPAVQLSDTDYVVQDSTNDGR